MRLKNTQELIKFQFTLWNQESILMNFKFQFNIWKTKLSQELSISQLPLWKIVNRLNTNKSRKQTTLLLRKSAITTQVYLMPEEVNKLELSPESPELLELLTYLIHLVLMVVFMEVLIQEPMEVLIEALSEVLTQVLMVTQQMLSDHHTVSILMDQWADMAH
jgi:hypothetical protein